MSPIHNTLLTALYAALLGALDVPLTEATRRKVMDTARSLACDLGVTFPLERREERRRARYTGEEARWGHE